MKPWKVQKFAGDVVYDLRSRGLLPVVVLLIVGMIAVPLVLVRSEAADKAPAVPVAQSAELAPENQAAVVAYEAGVRDYKKRLGETSPKDPFTQQFTTPEATATALQQSGVEVPSTSLSSGDGGGDASGVTGDIGGGESGGGGKTKVKTRYYSLETDVQIGVVGEQAVRRNRVQPFQYLPGADAPVLAFMGYGQKGKKAVFLVSDQVSAQEGQGTCFPSPETCQLLALGAKQSETLTFGEGAEAVLYKARVARIALKVTSKPPRG